MPSCPPDLQKLQLLERVRVFLAVLAASLGAIGSTDGPILAEVKFGAPVRQLESGNQTQLRSRRLWERTVEKDLLPALLRRAAAAGDRHAQQFNS